jgi:hypothetical protein
MLSSSSTDASASDAFKSSIADLIFFKKELVSLKLTSSLLDSKIASKTALGL